MTNETKAREENEEEFHIRVRAERIYLTTKLTGGDIICNRVPHFGEQHYLLTYENPDRIDHQDTLRQQLPAAVKAIEAIVRDTKSLVIPPDVIEVSFYYRPHAQGLLREGEERK